MIPDLLGLPSDDLARVLDGLGVGAVHAPGVFGAIHRGLPLDTVRSLGPRHAATLAAHTTRAVARVVATHAAPDHTVRLVLALADDARIEAVLVPMAGARTTLCLSTQVGCAMGCAFCATGTLGLTRSLTAGEIVAQVHAARAVAAGRSIDRVVFMGMGEPLHAYDATIAALRVLVDGAGPAIGSDRLVVSTVGLVDRMRRFAADAPGRVTLALSLHAGTDATRARIVPLARTVPLAALRDALRDLQASRPRPLMLEHVVLPGINDTDAEADGVAAFTDGLRAAVNLLPFNPFPGAPFRAPTDADVDAYAARLRARGVFVTVRRPRGRAADAACGQLALRAPAA